VAFPFSRGKGREIGYHAGVMAEGRAGREPLATNQIVLLLVIKKLQVLLSCLLILMSIDMTSYQQVSFGICQIVTRHVMHVSTMCPQAGKVS